MKNLTARERKRIARLKSELSKINKKAYKLDGNDGYEFGDRLNDRYDQKSRELKKLESK